MNNKPPSNPPDILERRAAILKELESVQALLNETNTNAPQEFQIPLLDPSKSTTHELNFSKPEIKTEPPPAPKPQPLNPEDIPTVDDITASGSLFSDDDDEETYSPDSGSKLTQAQLQSHAQLVIQNLLNEAMTEIEDKLEEWIPRLEEKLKKRLEKAMNQYIEDSLKK